jgi:dihydropteroate synthase
LNAPPRCLRAGGLDVELGPEPWLMGIVNASPDSFSDGGMHESLDAQLRLAEQLLSDGAHLLDIGGESASTERPQVEAEREIELVAPLVERIVTEFGAIVSVDTYKPAVARAAIAAGAKIVNDVSGLRDPELAEVCAKTGAGLVLMHTAAAPRERRQDPDLYDDVAEEVHAFLSARIELALERGMSAEQLIVDPGPDFAKTPAQTIRLMSSAELLHDLGRPVLMAISRKDFIGALTGRPPRERGAGTLAAFADGLDRGAHVFRIHDVAAAADFLAVRSALRDRSAPQEGLRLSEEIRYQRVSSDQDRTTR